jgi:hypothetical protein
MRVCFLLLVGCIALASGYRAPYGSDWVAVDGYARHIMDYENAPQPREGKTVGIFYWLWQGFFQSPIRDVTVELHKNPAHIQWVEQNYWHSQPEIGYYHACDPWVTRRHLQMLAVAGVDFVFFDFTNGYEVGGAACLDSFFQVSDQMLSDGIEPPKFVFFLNSDGPNTLRKIWANVYAQNKGNKHWFLWENKPLILAPVDFAQGNQQIISFFTWRKMWAFDAQEQDYWRFLDLYPQRPSWHISPNIPEQITVGKALGAPLIPPGGKCDKGSSFKQGSPVPQYNQYWETDLTINGYYFEDQWNRAHQVDPQIVTITGWNEMLAGAWPVTPQSGLAGWTFMGKTLQVGDWYFVDEFNIEFNRDIEPMLDGYSDNYYYQMVTHIRKFKGLPRPTKSSPPTTINLQDFAQWNNISPVYIDPPGDALWRNYSNADGSSRYSNTRGRNDIIISKVAHDNQYIYFYAQMRGSLSNPWNSRGWMYLYIDVDAGATFNGYWGYDYLLADGNGQQRTVCKYDGSKWVGIGSADLSFTSDRLAIRLPKNLIGAGQYPRFDFHWADNLNPTDIYDFFVGGDSAPDRRFNYRFDARQ